MTTPPWPDHLLTLAEWNALPEDHSRHFELAEGVLCVAPHAHWRHQRVMWRLCAALDEQLPDELTALMAVEMLVDESWPPTVRVPDVLVTRDALLAADPVRFPAREVLLAVEVTATGSRRADRVRKRAEYAEAGIPGYWIVDAEAVPVTLTAFRLADGGYEQVADGSGVVELASPFPVRMDLDGLVPRRL